MFNGFCHTVKGASHDVSGIGCQDSSGFKSYDNYSVAVVADGHGSKKHFRSDAGSAVAVQSTIDAVSEFYQDQDQFEKSFTENPKRVIRKIEMNIISRWNNGILKHFNDNPVTDKEKEPFDDEQFNRISLESMYGTTLIAAVMTKQFVFGMQIGDGSLVLIPDSCDAEMPILDDESCPANLTASISNSNAIDLFNSFYRFEQPLAVFVSTDGLFTSFKSNGDFLDYHLIISSQLNNSSDIDEIITRNLSKRTHYGTQDDISLSCAFNPGMIDENSGAIVEQIHVNKQRASMHSAEYKAKLHKQKLKIALMQKQNSDQDEL